MYVKSEVRKGLIGRMLNEILDTRVMVKQAMKGCRDDKVLHLFFLFESIIGEIIRHSNVCSMRVS